MSIWWNIASQGHCWKGNKDFWDLAIFTVYHVYLGKRLHWSLLQFAYFSRRREIICVLILEGGWAPPIARRIASKNSEQWLHTQEKTTWSFTRLKLWRYGSTWGKTYKSLILWAKLSNMLPLVCGFCGFRKCIIDLRFATVMKNLVLPLMHVHIWEEALISTLAN